MGKKKSDWGRDRTQPERAVSPVIAAILLVGIAVIGAAMIVTIGGTILDGLESQAHTEQSEQSLKQFDSDLTTIGLQNDTKRSTHLDEGTESEIVSDGDLTVTVSNGFVSRESAPIELQTVVTTDEGGNEFAYQAGGIWRLEGDRETAVSDPNVRYYTETIDGEDVGRIDVTPVTVEGNVSSGEHTIRQVEKDSFDSFGEDIEYVNYVTIEVEDTSYHYGWYNFLKDEFDATDDCSDPENLDQNVICHDETSETVTVVASVDGETALANLVDIEPTVYGGLYLEGDEDTLESSLTVTGYDDHSTGTNESEDLFLANYDTYNLHNNAEIQGMPVVNGTLSSKGNPTVSPVGYGVSVDEGPKGEKFDVGEDAYWLDAHENALATELSSPYKDIEEIDDEVDDVQTNYLDGNAEASGTVTDGSYDGADSINELDSSSGNVHIGVDGTLDLDSVEVKGDNRTSIYVDGNVDLSNVEIDSDDRANALWIYATSDSTVTISDDFQGVVYAPGADIEIYDDTTVDGAVVAGNPDDDAGGNGIGDNVQINFDRSLRTDTPLSDEDEDLSAVDNEARDPIDATFVLDRSGSMGPYDPDEWRAWVEKETIHGDNWEPIPVSEPFRKEAGNWVEVRNTSTGETKSLGPRDYAHPEKWDEIRVWCWEPGCSAELWVYERPGNDPKGKRIDATKNFIDLMNASNGDRVGIHEFNNNGYTVHSLDGNLEAAKDNLRVKAQGGTDMSAGFEQALDDYEANGEPDQKRVTVLLSDGKNSYDGYNDEMDDLVEEANDQDVTLYTVGLTGPNNADIPDENLERWAEDTGGEYYEADNAAALEELFEKIAEEEIDVDQNTEISITVENNRETTSGYAISVSEKKVGIDD